MIITSVITALSFESINSLSAINLLSIEKDKEIKQLDIIIGKVRELHSNIRDYVITKDSSYLRNVSLDKQEIETSFTVFLGTLNDNSSIKRETYKLKDLVNRKIAFNLNVLKLYSFGGRDIALEFIETGKASVLNDSIELITLNIKDYENKELVRSVTKYNGAAGKTKQYIVIASCLLFILGLLFMYTTISNLINRARIITELTIAKRNSEKAASLKDQFVSNVSHEIRTPLNSIIGFANLLNATKLDAEQYDFVFTIKNASENLLRIVNDILDFSKIEAGMMQIHRQPFNLYTELKNVQKLFDQVEPNDKLIVEYIIDPALPTVCIGDNVRLNQILINLIGNAIKFTERGKVTVQVLLKEIRVENIRVEFRITDTGIGIPRDKISKIFDRFEQVSSDSASKPQGTGLGLSITKSLVEMDGGSIDLTSTVGLGSEFIVIMTYGLPVYDRSVNNSSDVLPKKHYLPPLKGKVLLVEDNPLNQKLVVYMLNKWHIEFQLANNGIEACEQLKKSSYSLILMDIQMPLMDGIKATDIIRGEMNISTPIIALTAQSQKNHFQNFLNHQFDGYLIKPFQEFDLYDIICKYLQQDTYRSSVTNGLPENTSDEYLFLLDGLEKKHDNDRKYVKEMAEIFISQITKEVKDLEYAFAEKDYAKISSISHSMKSTISYIGLLQSEEQLLNNMESTTNININHIMADFESVRISCQKVCKQLESELEEYKV